MPSTFNFSDSRLAKLDGFQVEIDEAHERADIILNRPPYNIVSMPQRDQLRLVFETLDEDPRVRVIVDRSASISPVAAISEASWKPRPSMYRSSPGISPRRRAAPSR